MQHPAGLRAPQGQPLPMQHAGMAGGLPGMAPVTPAPALPAAAPANGVAEELAAILSALQYSAEPGPVAGSAGQSLGALAAVPAAAIVGAAAAEAVAPPPAAEAGVAALLQLVRRSRSAAEQLSAADALGRLAQGSPAAQTALVAGDGVKVLLRRLDSSRPAMRRAAAVVLLQVALGGPTQLAALQTEGGPNVLQLIQAALLADPDGSAAAADMASASSPQPAASSPQPAAAGAPAQRAELAQRGGDSDVAALVGAVNGLQLTGQAGQYGTLAALHGLLHAPPGDQGAFGPRGPAGHSM